ncbi:JmjC domain protein [Diplocarpon rosae]|nr:JmjC domain protein [Diplocarpon rosae]
MIRLSILTRSSRHFQRFYSSQNAISPVQSIAGPLDSIDVDEFRARAFLPERPLIITAPVAEGACHWIPAANKWFTYESTSNGSQTSHTSRRILSHSYLSAFASTILPYELTTPVDISKTNLSGESYKILPALMPFLRDSSGNTFHRFSAPLSLFLEASSGSCPGPPSLYIAQAQLIDLPRDLQADLPTPFLVANAGKGDVYDANIWMGIPPTYTPLHKDPNSNLFVQLASRKQVRLFRKDVGDAIFSNIRERIGYVGSSDVIRGNEMMEGLESEYTKEAVWGEDIAGRISEGEGLETIVGPGDALFIPKGWWHSFMSLGNDVTASVNWWFR